MEYKIHKYKSRKNKGSGKNKTRKYKTSSKRNTRRKYKSIRKHKSSRKHKSQRKHNQNMRGGNVDNNASGGEVKAVFPKYDSPVVGNPAMIIKELQANAENQNMATKTLTGGSRRKYKIYKNKNKKYRKQNGGNATLCTTSLINSADGYGYVPPVGCIPVPIVSDPNAQGLAIESVHISATGAENAKYDNLIGK
jgi:hypothetical protein